MIQKFKFIKINNNSLMSYKFILLYEPFMGVISWKYKLLSLYNERVLIDLVNNYREYFDNFRTILIDLQAITVQ